MRIRYGNSSHPHGPGVWVDLDGDEVATALMAYLTAHGVHIDGPRTVTVNCELCQEGAVFVDPIGFVVADGKRWEGRGEVSTPDTRPSSGHPDQPPTD